MITNQLLLTRQDILTMIEHDITRMDNFDLAVLLSQFGKSKVSYIDTADTFVWIGGEFPAYLPDVIEYTQLQKGLDNQE